MEDLRPRPFTEPTTRRVALGGRLPPGHLSAAATTGATFRFEPVIRSVARRHGGINDSTVKIKPQF